MKLLRLSPILLLLAFAQSLPAQNRTSFAGLRNAFDFAYGINGNISALVVDNPSPTAPGAATLILQFGQVTLPDGTRVAPLTTTTPITVGNPTTASFETVLPTAVSCTTPGIYDTCTVTATFSNAHGKGEMVTSGSYGVVEAANAAHAFGGLVAMDGRCYVAGLTNSKVVTYRGWTNATLLDWSGTTGAKSYAAASNGGLYVVTAVSLY